MKTNNLKSILIVMLITLFGQIQSGNLQRKGLDSIMCLQIQGKIISETKGQCLVELISYNKTVDSTLLEEGESKFRFNLEKNASYTIRITKEGHVVRLVCINTSVPFDHEGIFRFRFTTKLMDSESSKRLNVDALDFPVALIYYDHNDNCFEYCKQYTNSIKRDWYKSNPNGLLSVINK